MSDALPPDEEQLSEDHTCGLLWNETLGTDGEPVALYGEARVNIEDEAGVGAAHFHFPVQGDPATFDEQLDAALAGKGWQRISDVDLWAEEFGPVGKCTVRRLPVSS